MTKVIPQEYAIQQFFLYSGGVESRPDIKGFNGSCAICREGKSWLRKKRSFYLLDKDIICCHNCGWSSRPYKWIKAVSKMSHNEIMKDCESFDTVNYSIDKMVNEATTRRIDTLPIDSINIGDPTQRQYYKDNEVVQHALKYIVNRNFHRAINRPKTFFISLVDEGHKNRLIIPYYDSTGNITCYQSRSIYDSDELKYKTKPGKKTLYGLNNIDPSLENIFITEGPSDAMFIKNGTCVSGINQTSLFTDEQSAQLQQFPFHNIVWVIDSPYLDNTARGKIETLVKQKENVFIWPREEGTQYKDIADMCMDRKMNGIPTKWILDNTYSGFTAQMKLKMLRF